MNKTVIFGALLVLALSFVLTTTHAQAVAPRAPGGTPGPPGAPGTPGGGQPTGTGPQTTPGAQATAHAGLRGKPTIYRGTISVVDATSLTLTLGDGTSVIVGLTSDTKIRVPGPNAQGDTLLVGMQVVVWVQTDANGNMVARAVMAIPGKPVTAHRVGTVTEYTPGLSITIMAVDGNAYTFGLTAETKILPAERAGELAVGSRVTVIAPRDPAALGWTAAGIVVHPASP
jgi:hypothetical protein